MTHMHFRRAHYSALFLTQMCARFSPQQVSHAVERGCGCARARESAVKSSIAQSTAACAGPAFGGGPARRQPVPPQGAEALAFTGRRTMNTRGTRPGLSPMFYRWAEPSLTVQPLGTGRPLAISAVYRGPDFPRACSSSPDTDGVLQPRKSMTMLDLLAMEPAKAAPIPERNLPHNVAHEFGVFYSSSSAGRLLFWFYAPDNRLRCTPAFRRGAKGMSGALNLENHVVRVRLPPLPR